MHRQNDALVRLASAVLVGLEKAAHRGGTQVAGLGIDIDKYRRRASLNDAGGGRDKRHRSGDHFVAGTYVMRHQGEAQRVGSGADANHVAHAEKIGELFFESLDVRTADVGGVLVNLRHLAIDTLANLFVHRGKIDKLNLHPDFPFSHRRH